MAAAADLDPAAGKLGERAAGQVELAARAGQMVGIGLLVEGVGGRRLLGEAADGVERFEDEGVLAQGPEGAVGPRAGRRGDGRALEDLAHVQGQAGVEAEADRQGGENGRVVAAAGQDDLAAGGQGLLDGLDAHLGDDVDRRVEDLRSQRRNEGQGDDLALVEVAEDPGLGHVGVDDAHLEGQLLLRRDLADDLLAPVDVGPGPAAAGRADDDRDAAADAGRQHEAEVALDRRPVGERLPRPEVVGAGVGRAGVDADEVGPALEAFPERGFREAVAEDGRRRQDAELFLLGRHIRPPSRRGRGARPGRVPSRCGRS